ncbi:GNAT family N-acetyltransferase [Halobium salinum]|uniref:GNAT family N-acetyltransferase n=1 Tax=Halobium salinum TaxID=1364940 RepID=A0ABD5P8W6_9EURY|nr:GNAT family protein [Halobium salinum]
MFPVGIDTDRLRLRRLTREELPPLVGYEHLGRRRSDAVAEETRFLSWSPHETPKETHDYLERVEDSWDDRGAAHYAVYPREGEDGAGEFAGTTALDVDWEKQTATLGIWLRRRFWGRGYSGERAAALFRLAFGRLDLDLVAVFHHPENEQSRRAVEKYVDAYGGCHEGVLRNWAVDADGEPADRHRYSVSRAEWREAVEGGGGVGTGADAGTTRFLDECETDTRDE